MSKYLYPIYRLKTKSYIRWWLYNYLGKFNNYILSEILTGTSFYLEDSIDRKFNIFDTIGRTTQESTTGKNLANVPENWSFTRYVAIPIDLEAGDYIISIKNGTNNGTTNTNIFIADDNNNRLGSFGFPKNSGEKNANITINSKATKLMCYSQYDYTSGENITATINQFMIRKASVTDDTYEPYTGGEPAPNPIYPYAIKNTGDNGSVNEKVSNSDGTQEQNLSFPLAQGQKLYEGEELKENEKDDIWSEYIFTGEENWTLYSETENVLKAYSVGPKLGRTNNMESTEDAFCTHFKNNTFYSSTNGIGLTQNATYVSVSKTIASNVSELKSWFATQYTNETPVKVQYKKKNPTTTPYTEEQQQYYDEHIKPLRTYKNITHITSSDETPAELKIQYWKEV